MTTNQDYEDAGDQQGFADLREGRSRRITPEVLQQEQDAVSSELTWRNVLADYRYLRATLNALVQPDRQLSVKELVDSALNHDTMHSDTAMVILMQLAEDPDLVKVVIRDHNAALASPAGADLALVRSTLESKIKDDRYHPQYILGMAFAHQLLESVTAAGTDALEAKAALLADTLDDVLQWRTIADATQAALDEAVKALAELCQELETRRTEAAEVNWQDWKDLLAAERANTAEAVKQRDAKQEAYLQEIKYADGLERERDEARAELATAIAVRDDNEAVAVERLARLALVEAEGEALADALKFYGDSPYKHYHPADAPCLLCAALATHEALKTLRNGLVVNE